MKMNSSIAYNSQIYATNVLQLCNYTLKQRLYGFQKYN